MACNRAPEATNDVVIDLNSYSAIDPKAVISLENLGWTAELIPLETSTDETLLRDISQIKESGEYFWIVTDSRVLQFGKDGSFKAQIGRIGPGPEEYVAAHKISVDEKNKELYVMDYFGRKMVVFHWDGSFAYSFPLPEDYSFDNFFRSGDDQLYFCSMINAVQPDILLYDPETQQSDTISYREREMGPEAFLGYTWMYDLHGETYVYHYFNDTVYTLRDNRLEPAWLIAASKMTFRYKELEMQDDFTPVEWPDGPRMHVVHLIESPRYIFVFYKVDSNKEIFKRDVSTKDKFENYMAMYDKTDGTYYPHVNIRSVEKPWLNLENGTLFHYSPSSGSFLATKEAADLMDDHVIPGLREDDNPVLIRYTR